MSLNRYVVPALVAAMLVGIEAASHAETTTQSAVLAGQTSKAEQQMKARVNALMRQRQIDD
jgi:hypothetical protein